MVDCIVSVGAGGTYPKGVDRLERSLLQHGFDGEMILYRELPPGAPTHAAIPYAMKLTALKIAEDRGYRSLLWLDASMVCIRNPKDMFDEIAEKGYYLSRSGWNCAQSVSDACLELFGVTRDQAELWPECASGTVGMDLNTAIGREFFDRWYESSLNGAFNGSRDHDNQSSDPRFKFHRQDQSAASLIANQMGLYMYDPHHFYCDLNDNMEPSIIFYRHGLYR